MSTDTLESPPVETPLPSPVPATDAPSATPAADDDSLAAHIEAHGEKAPEHEGRDESGKFTPKPRRRAQSQEAAPDDVPAINELTKRLKAAEEAAGKDIVRKEGESERVFTLRRRAEIAERLAKPVDAPKPTAAPAPPPVSRQSQSIPASFPAYEDFVQLPGNEQIDYDTYRDLRDDWGYRRRRELERQQDAIEREQRTFHERLTAHQQREQTAKTKYPDWEAVVMPGVPADRGGLPITFVLRDAILASNKSDDIQYFLGKHRDVLAELVADSQDYSPSAVAAMRRYLDTLVAPATSSPSSQRPAADPTGAAPALPSRPAPKPPTPVRTSALMSDDPPDPDDQSLAAHAAHFGRRRAR